MAVPVFEGVELSKVAQVNIDGDWLWIEEGSFEAKENNFVFKTNEAVYSIQPNYVYGVRTVIS